MPPSTEPSASRQGTLRCSTNAPPAAEAISAPIMMPKSSTEIRSANTDPDSDFAFAGTCQNAQCETSTPSPPRIFDPHRPNAEVTPHGWPDTYSTAALSTPSTTAPTHIGQDPRSTLANPRAVGGSATGGGLRRLATAYEAATTSAITASESTSAPG